MKLAGHYIRVSPGDSAEIRLASSKILAGRYHVKGLALWGEGRPYGPNFGELNFTAELDGDCLEHTAPNGDETYRVMLQFKDGLLFVTEENSSDVHGMNVTFEGTYRRASATISFARLVSWAVGRLIERVAS